MEIVVFVEKEAFEAIVKELPEVIETNKYEKPNCVLVYPSEPSRAVVILIKPVLVLS